MSQSQAHAQSIKELLPLLYGIASAANPEHATFDHLAEEVLELHLASRGRHSDSPEMELLEIATIAMNMLAKSEQWAVFQAADAWHERHGKEGLQNGT